MCWSLLLKFSPKTVNFSQLFRNDIFFYPILSFTRIFENGNSRQALPECPKPSFKEFPMQISSHKIPALFFHQISILLKHHNKNIYQTARGFPKDFRIYFCILELGGTAEFCFKRISSRDLKRPKPEVLIGKRIQSQFQGKANLEK